MVQAGLGKLKEIEQEWTLLDLVNAHEVIDVQQESEAVNAEPDRLPPTGR